ncbi:MAG TPA: hypothetical protein VMW01_05430 [Williamwhitmania sp.]|nr:hypothetical protein [Williamwhitmania sp.]
MRGILLIFLIFLAACTSATKLHNTSTTSNEKKEVSSNLMAYHSGANGMADIQLTLRTDNTFSLYMKPLEPSESGEKVSTVNTSGRWRTQGDWTRLTFKKGKLIVRSLFDSTYTEGHQFKLINDRTVDIKSDLKELTIWGIVCNKVVK